MVHVVRLIKSGNSYGVMLPAPVREAMHLARGDQLVVTVERGRIVLMKLNEAVSAELIAAVGKAES